MSFLHPAMLALLPLAAIPLILHLIMLHRLKITELSTYRFLFESYVRQQTRLKFVEALLAALRTLFVLLLVLLVCRPVLKHWSALFRSGSGTEITMLVDCSASMNARTEGVSALERSKASAYSVCERLGRSERATLVRIGSKAEEVFNKFSSNQGMVREKIEALDTTPSRANMFGAVKWVFQPGAKREGISSLYLFTDCQSNGWREARQQGIGQLIPEGTRVTVVNVGSRKAIPNSAIIGDETSRERAIVGLPIIFRPRVACYGCDEPTEVTVKAFVNEQEAARVSLTLKPGENRVAEMSYVPRESGVMRGRFEIQPDRFPDDDTFLFTLSVMPQVRVVLANGAPSQDAFENEALFLRTALTTAVLDEDDKKTAADGVNYKDFARSLDVREIPEWNLNPETIREASLVILANCGQLNAQHFEWVRAFVSGGGGLIIFPGDLVNPKTYNSDFFPVPGPQKECLTAVEFAAAEGNPRRADAFERFTAIDFHHPVFVVFDNPEAKYFSTARFYRHFPLNLAEGRVNAWPLARFSSGYPALVESRLGKGVTLTAAFPVNAKWSNLPLKPEFVPLMLRMVNYVQRRPDVDVPSVATEEGTTEIVVAADWGSVSGTVTDEAGHSSPVAFKRSGVQMVGVFDQPRAKGYYTVAVRSDSPANVRTGAVVVAVNTPEGESDFGMITEDEIRKLMPKARVTVVDASAEAQQLYGAVGDEREVWRAMIWFMFAVIGTEFVLATLGGRKKAAKRKGAVAIWIEELMPEGWAERVIRILRLQS